MKKIEFVDDWDFSCLKKIFRIMRTTLFLLFAVILQTFANEAYSQKTKLSLDYTNARLEVVLDDIENLSEFFFLANEKLVDLNRNVSFSVKNKRINEILDILFAGTDVVYTITDRKIILTPSFLTENIYADVQQQRSVSGKVTDSNNQPLPGVTVVVKGTTQGAVTDINGDYLLTNIPEDATLVFSFVGMRSQEVVVGSQTVVNVGMEEETIGLEEVVAVGYGTQKRVEMSTSVSKMDITTLENVHYSNVGSALQGAIPGLKVTTNTGQPGSTPSILLRGGTDWDGGQPPLVIVDGITSSLKSLNSNDIASIEVLKDAAATSIYGARASNGVILITTKRGDSGKTQISYKYNLGINTKQKGYTYMSSEQYLLKNRIAWKDYVEITGRDNFNSYIRNSGVGWTATGNADNSIYAAMYLDQQNEYLLNEGWKKMEDPLYGLVVGGNTFDHKYLLFQDNDMSNLFFQNSQVHNHHFSVSGGNKESTYALGVGYQDNKGIVLSSGFKRFTGNLNADYKIKDNLKVISTVSFTRSLLSETYLGSSDLDYWWIFNRAAGQPPTSRIYNADGSLNPGLNISFGNPLYYQDKFLKWNKENQLSTALSLDWDISPLLKLTIKGTYLNINASDESFDKSHSSAGALITTRDAKGIVTDQETFQYNAILNYNNRFFDDHNFNFLLGTEYYDYNYKIMEASTKGSPTDLIPTMNVGSEPTYASSLKTGNRIISGFGRVSYDYKMKYLFNFNFRYDGSSKLINNRRGFFPGVSVGWNLHSESFFQEVNPSNIFSKIKPRFSYGVNGNIDGLSDYEAYGGYQISSIYSNNKGYYNNAIPLKNLKWESSRSLNLGLEIGLFDERFDFMVDYFIRDIKDKITPYKLPSWTGFSSINTNIGTLRNKGLELEFNANIINQKDGVKWNIGVNAFTVKNYVKKLPNNDLPNNRQGGTEIFNPSTGKVEWVGGLQEGQRVGTDLVISYVQEYVYANENEVAEHSNRYDASFPAGQNYDRVPGDVAWKDVDQNDTIDYRDRVILGRLTPKWIGGITSTLSYKGVSLFIKTDYATGHLIDNNIRRSSLQQGQGSQNGITEVLDSWSPNNIHTDVPRFVFVDPHGNHSRNSRYWEKGDFFALREVTLSYNLPEKIISKYFNSIRVYFSGSNLLYFTKYSGLLPESGGLDRGRYPLPRVYSFGIDINI